jgi:uncharacterized protein
MATPRIPLPHDALADFCRRHGLRSLSFFGSVLRDDFTDESDVDVLIELEPGHTVGYIGFAGLEEELSELLGRKGRSEHSGDAQPLLPRRGAQRGESGV